MQINDTRKNAWTTPARMRTLQLLVLVTLFGGIGQARAHAEVLTARQDSAGQVHVSLRGEFVWCDPQLGGFRTEPEATVVPGQISILSISHGLECAPPPPPPWVPPPPVPYRLDMNLGVLPEGSYDVSWRIQDGDFAPQFILRTTTIQVGTPVLIPLPLGSGVWGSALLLFGVGLFALRRRGGWA